MSITRDRALKKYGAIPTIHFMVHQVKLLIQKEVLADIITINVNYGYATLGYDERLEKRLYGGKFDTFYSLLRDICWDCGYHITDDGNNKMTISISE